MTNMGELQEWFQEHYAAECDERRREEMRIPGPKDGLGRFRFGVSFGYAGGMIRIRAMLDRNWAGWLDLNVHGSFGRNKQDRVRQLIYDCLGVEGIGWSEGAGVVEPIHYRAMRWEGDRPVLPAKAGAGLNGGRR